MSCGRIVLLLVALFGCDKVGQSDVRDRSPEESARPASQAKVSETQEQAPPKEPVKTEKLPEPIQEAVAAASEDQGDGPVCEQAYRGLSAAMQRLKAKSTEGMPHSMPSQHTFMQTCESLPEGVQQCLILPYAIEHQGECQRHQDSLDEPTKAKLQALLQGEP